MATVKLYGASDDLLEIDGHINDEIYVDCEKKTTIVVSDGSVFQLSYDSEGCWRFKCKEKGTAGNQLEPAIDGDAERRPGGESGYSDILTLTGDIKWIRVRGKMLKVKG